MKNKLREGSLALPFLFICYKYYINIYCLFFERIYMDEKIIIIDDVYTQEEIENNEASIINDAKWEYSAVSDEDTYGAESSIFFISNKVNSLLQQKIISDFLLSAYIQHSISMPKDKQTKRRVYLNGQTYGLDGQWHIDIDSLNYYTLLYMVNTGDVSNIGNFQYINPSNNLSDFVIL